jgi:hypothetical protein
LFGDSEEDYGESFVGYPGLVSRRGVRVWYPTVSDEPLTIATRPSLRTTVGIGFVPGHRRYYRGKQNVTRLAFPRNCPVSISVKIDLNEGQALEVESVEYVEEERI